MTDVIRKRMIAEILAVNDLCPDEKHKLAMRAIVMAAVNRGFNALVGYKAEQGSKAGRRKPRP